MAIVPMNKISIVGLESQKSQILKLLMKRGFVQIDDSAYLTEEEEWRNFLMKDGEESKVMEIDQKAFQIEQAINAVRSEAKIKNSFFAPQNEFEAMTEDEAEENFLKAKEINDAVRQMQSLQAVENNLTNAKNQLIPWIKYDVPFDGMETKSVRTILGTIPAGVNINQIREKFDEESFAAFADVVDQDKLLQYIYIAAHKSCFDDVTESLKNFGFSAVSFHEEKGTPAQCIKGYEEKLQENNKLREEIGERVKGSAYLLPKLENAYDYFTLAREEKSAVGNLVKTQNTFLMEGWVPRSKSDALTKELTEKFICSVDSRQADAEDNYPILLKNNALVTPFESITNMYSCPAPGEIDPNPIMAFFYFVFFGLMLSDAGYGLIIAAVCGFVVWKKKYPKGQGNLIKMLALCGVSTVLWGLVFGSIFGDLFPVKAMINPLEDVMLLMGLSFLFGIIHIYVGLGIKAVNLIRSGHAFDAAVDVGSWYLFVTGVCLLVVPVVAGDIGIWSTVGKYLAIIGAVLLVLTQGRSFRGIFTKAFKGVSSLYDITGYMSDILSYSRLMALCLSTGVISQVINLLGQMAGPVPAIIIGVIGHTVNLLINALGAYVHTSRLQYVEFFGKFYEGGGIPFKPFQYKTKYTNIKNEEM